MPRRAFAIVDLGFGDAGKGLVTDFLVRQTGATVVVRFNGGAQAGHNVVTTDGRHHTFAQFGSGTFVPGVKTLLSRHVVVDPLALFVEAGALRQVGVAEPLSRLSIHPEALLATPYHRAVNCLREARRGPDRHGSCGVGFGETVQDALSDPLGALRAADLRELPVLRRKIAVVAERKLGELRALGGEAEAALLAAPAVAERVAQAFAEVGRLGVVVAGPRWNAELRAAETVIFEGAQGLLLCERHGFPPHTTWSRCDLHNVGEVVAEASRDGGVTRIGVLRALAVRHGPGPLPTEDSELRALVVEPHNLSNPWQGPVRHGWFDSVLGRYAIAALGGVDALAITHLDSVAALPAARVCEAYRLGDREVRDLRELSPLDDEPSRAALGVELRRAQPLFEGFAARSMTERLGCEVGFEARGPTAAQVRLLRPL